MKLWTKIGLAALVAALYGMTDAKDAHACMAAGQPKVKITLEKNGTGKAVISEYDCTMMVRKTNCVVGLRLSDQAQSDTRIAIRSLRFVDLATGQPLQGFAPTANPKTTAAWNHVMDGTWYGFSAVYNANILNKGGLGIEVTFSYDPEVSEQRIAQALDYGHVGLAEGDGEGRIAHGHMLEVVQIQGASLTRG
ncbi:MAG TPA: hypothetical protein VGD08_27010 [Stellaceae bacterium]